jgi:hypothetical protein
VSDPGPFQKAKLKVGGKDIPCLFNPQSYTVSKTNIWTYKPNQTDDCPKPEFGGGQPMVFKLTLLLDTSLTPDKDVTEQADALMEGMHGSGSAPADVEFTWGEVKFPKSKPVSIAIKYALFRPDGKPIRAFVDLELAQSEQTAKVPGQNPTTRAIAGLRVHRVRDGDSLPSIAYEHYSDATRWRTIAEANDINDPIRLRRGAELTIPRIDT